MIVGVDFDNTIICYDQVFYLSALREKLIPPNLPKSKNSVRNYLRQMGKEEEWTRLQGLAYGRDLMQTMPFPGVREFLRACKERSILTFIISHKTKHPVVGPQLDLHAAAFGWLEAQGFLNGKDSALTRESCFFELTKDDKLKRIEALGCSVFIDDLPEFLREQSFPKQVKRILFDPHNQYMVTNGLTKLCSWTEINALLVRPYG